jgi:hypothetical protein
MVNLLNVMSTLVKKLMFSALKKQRELRLFRAECGQLGRAGQLATFSGEKNGATRLSTLKRAIHGVNWHFSALLRLARSLFHKGNLSNV